MPCSMGSIYVICSRQCPKGDGIYTLLYALYKYSTSITNQPTNHAMLNPMVPISCRWLCAKIWYPQFINEWDTLVIYKTFNMNLKIAVNFLSRCYFCSSLFTRPLKCASLKYKGGLADCHWQILFHTVQMATCHFIIVNKILKHSKC